MAARTNAADPFEFDLHLSAHREADPYGYGVETAKVKAKALVGGRLFEPFSIDLTTRRHLDAPVDRIELTPVIEHETMQGLPLVPTTPVENHLADKICALYESHGEAGATASSRYRDLADIVRIVESLPFDASRLAQVLRREADRRRMQLPDRLRAPSDSWTVEFPRAAAQFAEYPRALQGLDAALSFCAGCLDGVLGGDRTSGRWDPASGAWL